MSLRSEVKEAMVATLEEYDYPETAASIRAENWERGSGAASDIAAARAILSVIDQWEEVRICENKYCEGLLHFEGEPGFDPERSAVIQTVLRRKQEPEPDLKELGLQLCEALEGVLNWWEGAGTDEVERTVAAFKKAAGVEAEKVL